MVHVTTLFSELHWLWVAARIKHKTLTLAYKTTHFPHVTLRYCYPHRVTPYSDSSVDMHAVCFKWCMQPRATECTYLLQVNRSTVHDTRLGGREPTGLLFMFSTIVWLGKLNTSIQQVWKNCPRRFVNIAPYTRVYIPCVRCSPMCEIDIKFTRQCVCVRNVPAHTCSAASTQ